MKINALRLALNGLPDDVEVFVPCTELVKGQLLTTDLIVVEPMGEKKIIIAPNEGAWAGKSYKLSAMEVTGEKLCPAGCGLKYDHNALYGPNNEHLECGWIKAFRKKVRDGEPDVLMRRAYADAHWCKF